VSHGPTPAWAGSVTGVQAQFDEGWDPGILDSAVSAGIRPSFVRMSFLRPKTEPSQGAYDFTSYAPALAKMHALGLRHTMTLFYGATPWDGDFTGFANYAVAAARYEEANFPGTLALLEIWNEPDGSWPVSSTDCVRMAEAIHDAVRVDSSLNKIPIAGCASAWVDIDYWHRLIHGGILKFIDVVSVHSYNSPEGLLAVIPTLQTMMGANQKPIYVSEWGAESTHPEKIPRRLSVMKAMGVLAGAYFPLRDYPLFSTEGLLTSGGGTKSQCKYWAEWVKRIGDDAAFVKRDMLNSHVFSYEFLKYGASVRHMWATEPTSVLIDGARTTLTTRPIYMDSATSIVLDPANDALLADLLWDFTLAAQAQPFTFLSRNNDDSAETEMIPYLDRWIREGTTFCYIKNTGAIQPEIAFKCVQRWLAPSNMNIRVKGSVWRAQAPGDGTHVRILHNTAVRFSRRPLTKADGVVRFDLTFSILAGDRVDFEVGSGGAENNWDEIYFNDTAIYRTG